MWRICRQRNIWSRHFQRRHLTREFAVWFTQTTSPSLLASCSLGYPNHISLIKIISNSCVQLQVIIFIDNTSKMSRRSYRSLVLAICQANQLNSQTFSCYHIYLAIWLTYFAVYSRYLSFEKYIGLRIDSRFVSKQNTTYKSIMVDSDGA
jgi:hypothetical protein